MTSRIISLLVLLIAFITGAAQNTVAKKDTFYLLQPDRIFDGEQMHAGWWVLVKNDHIETVGTQETAKPTSFPKNAIVNIIDLKNKTLLPGFIEGHSHLFLHPYNETDWNN